MTANLSVMPSLYAALWAAAPFPRLPDDAPAELKKLTIDIDDPKRVYAIHRASRRHHFQILVERSAYPSAVASWKYFLCNSC